MALGRHYLKNILSNNSLYVGFWGVKSVRLIFVASVYRLKVLAG